MVTLCGRAAKMNPTNPTVIATEPSRSRTGTRCRSHTAASTTANNSRTTNTVSTSARLLRPRATANSALPTVEPIRPANHRGQQPPQQPWRKIVLRRRDRGRPLLDHLADRHEQGSDQGQRVNHQDPYLPTWQTDLTAPP